MKTNKYRNGGSRDIAQKSVSRVFVSYFLQYGKDIPKKLASGSPRGFGPLL